MHLGFTTLFIRYFNEQMKQFPAFIAFFRRKEAVIMQLSDVCGKKTTFIRYFNNNNCRQEVC